MAKTLKPGDGGSTAAKITLGDLDRFLNDANRHKTNASEHAGFLGQATSQFCERFGLSRKAVTWTRTLAGLEPAKRTEIVAELLMLFGVKGWMDENTLFGTPQEQAKSDVAAAKGKGKKGDGATGADIQKALDAEAAKVVPLKPAEKPVDEFDAAAPPAPPPTPTAPAPGTVQ